MIRDRCACGARFYIQINDGSGGFGPVRTNHQAEAERHDAWMKKHEGHAELGKEANNG